MIWTDDMTAQLRQMWTDGMSAAQIGKVLHMSRNAVLGRAHRIKLPARREAYRQNNKSQKRKSKVTKRPRIVNYVKRARITRTRPEKDLPVVPASLNLSLMQLEANHCRYPTSVDPTLFCGAEKTGPLSYCRFHIGLCYLPAKDRKDATRKATDILRRAA